MSIDEVSAAIGELKADAKASQNQRAQLFTEVGDIKTMIADLTVVVQTSIVAGQGRLDEVEEDVKAQGKQITSLNKVKQRMYVAVASIGGIGGVTATLTQGLAKKLGLN